MLMLPRDEEEMKSRTAGKVVDGSLQIVIKVNHPLPHRVLIGNVRVKLPTL